MCHHHQAALRAAALVRQVDEFALPRRCPPTSMVTYLETVGRNEEDQQGEHSTVVLDRNQQESFTRLVDCRGHCCWYSWIYWNLGMRSLVGGCQQTHAPFASFQRESRSADSSCRYHHHHRHDSIDNTMQVLSCRIEYFRRGN